jgi:hypothetical protein
MLGFFFLKERIFVARFEQKPSLVFKKSSIFGDCGCSQMSGGGNRRLSKEHLVGF